MLWSNFKKSNKSTESLISENEYFGTDYRHLIHKKYRIIYRLLENSVFILRIVHGAKLLEL